MTEESLLPLLKLTEASQKDLDDWKELSPDSYKEYVANMSEAVENEAQACHKATESTRKFCSLLMAKLDELDGKIAETAKKAGTSIDAKEVTQCWLDVTNYKRIYYTWLSSNVRLLNAPQ